MSDLEKLLEGNTEFAARYKGGLSNLSRFKTIVFTCSDSRVDPAHFLGLKPGDAFVFRALGARVSKELELELAILWTMAGNIAKDKFHGFELVIIQHTNCGFEKFGDAGLQQALSENLDLDKAVFATLANADHSKAIREDIERLRRPSLVPDELIVSGYLYDVEDGTLRQVAPPKTLRGSAS